MSILFYFYDIVRMFLFDYKLAGKPCIDHRVRKEETQILVLFVFFFLKWVWRLCITKARKIIFLHGKSINRHIKKQDP